MITPMNRRQFLGGVAAAASSRPLIDRPPAYASALGATAQGSASREQQWVALAERLKPHLRRTTKSPVSLVRPVAAPETFLRWRIDAIGPAAALPERLLKPGDSVTLDFGTHLTGYVTLSLAGQGRGIDAPARLKLTFGEVPGEVVEPFDPYKGWLSRAWLQDEVINVDVLPATIALPRRYAFRYAKIDVVATSPNYAVRIHDVSAAAVTSAGDPPPALSSPASERLRRIDEVSVHTLRECMQTVFEDGPKRDRRLWIGDLRLQALTNYATFRNYDLVKRCLYLFAGLPREDGLVSACVFEDPQPTRGHEYIMDYAALYAACVLEYANASGDWSTARDLWPVVQRQMEILLPFVSDEGVFVDPGGWWIFVDWSPTLEKTAAMHGILLYSLRQALELARYVGAGEVGTYEIRIGAMAQAGHRAFFDQARGVFVSGPKRQVSWATQAWMVLSGIASPTDGARVMRALPSMSDAVRPGGPYLYHYVIEAMLRCGMKREALDLLTSYWGGMVDGGADTFWEVYDPKDPMLSPYGNVLSNSYCHAWSCTPAWLLRTGFGAK
jgi:alpha-L-rhamnosidase